MLQSLPSIRLLFMIALNELSSETIVKFMCSIIGRVYEANRRNIDSETSKTCNDSAEPSEEPRVQEQNCEAMRPNVRVIARESVGTSANRRVIGPPESVLGDECGVCSTDEQSALCR